jgi:hypothetical protein
MDVEIVKLLLSSTNYRSFMKLAFAYYLQRNTKFGYSWFARRAGFVSRSFPRDVLLGKRRITQNALQCFLRGFELQGEAAEYFRLLVALDEKDLLPEPMSQKKIRLMLEMAGSRLQKIISPEAPDHVAYTDRLWPFFYAALGEKGTAESVATKLGMAIDDCKPILEKMERYGVLGSDAKQPGTYICLSPHLVFEQLGKSLEFRDFFFESMLRCARRAKADFSAIDSIYVHSTLSLSKSVLEEHGSKLREHLLKFVDGAENPEGDVIWEIVLAATPFRGKEIT